jgi:hypothetical protein
MDYRQTDFTLRTLKEMPSRVWNLISRPSEYLLALLVCLLMTREIWQSLGVADDHILTGNAKDNFWGELHP